MRLSGVLCHPTSFPSKYGIGDFGKGCYDFIDFLFKSQQKLWQILPLGPTSFKDSPYQSFSSFAGNTNLIDPELLLTENLLDYSDLELDKNLNNRKVEYGKVIEIKDEIFRKAFCNFDIECPLFKKFQKNNKQWLDDYSLFISLKSFFINKRKVNQEDYPEFLETFKDSLREDIRDDYYYGAVWSSWPKDILTRTNEGLIKYRDLLADEINYNNFLQYIFYKQWELVKEYANKRDIKIIGDIPIFVAYDSCDVWANQNIFKLDSNALPTKVAGVPPDYFSETGQLWGNPLYDWPTLRKLNYKWWVQRIKHALTNVDILRIDHFRGFSSYWEIPFKDKTAVNGKWAKGPGIDLFDTLSKKLGKMNIIAEDLGEPHEPTSKLRKRLDFKGMKVLQFAFGDTNQNDYLPHNFENSNTVIYVGTHDNDTTWGWYKNTSERARDHYRRYLNVSGEDVSYDFIRLAFSSSAEFAIITMQDIMNLDDFDRMNTPGVDVGNWQFRYTEDMINDTQVDRLVYLSDLFNRNM